MFVVRTLDLKTTAALNRLPELLHWPSLKKSGLLNLVICLLYSLVIPAVVFPTGRMEMMNQEDFCTSRETMTECRLCILADVTYIFKGLQKCLWKDMMPSELQKLKLDSLKDERLTGG